MKIEEYEKLTPEQTAQRIRDWLESGSSVPFRGYAYTLFRVPAAPKIEYVFETLTWNDDKYGAYGMPSNPRHLILAMIWDNDAARAYAIDKFNSAFADDKAAISILGTTDVPAYSAALGKVRATLADTLANAVETETIQVDTKLSCAAKNDALGDYIRHNGDFGAWFSEFTNARIYSMTKDTPTDAEIIEAIKNEDECARKVSTAVAETAAFKLLVERCIAAKRFFAEIEAGDGVDLGKVNLALSIKAALDALPSIVKSVTFVMGKASGETVKQRFDIICAHNFAETLGERYAYAPIESVRAITYGRKTIWSIEA